jgi:hypothetical protein
MASEDTLLGNELRLQIGDGNSPEIFVDMCSASDVSGIGEQKPQVDVTTLCDLARKFRGGLAEGSEVTLTANLIQGDAQTRELFEAYKADDVVNFRLTIVGSSPEEFFAFSASLLGWTVNPPVGDKATMVFTLKISGEVTWVYDDTVEA